MAMPGAMPGRRRAAALLGTALLGGCTPLGLLDAMVPRGSAQADTGIAYGAHPRQRLDLYRPAGGGPWPLVVWFYGGAWRSGDRGDYRFVAAALAGHGIATAIPDYRLYPEGAFPTFLEDAAEATAWAGTRAAALGADPARVVLAGHSAGAHIALLLALDARRLARAGWDRRGLAGAIGLAGPYDFLPLRDPAVQAVFAAADDLRETQPIAFADAGAPPLLLLTGTDDTTVGPGNSDRLAARARAAGGSAEVRRYPGLAHIGVLTALAPPFRWRAPVLADMAAFAAAPPPLPRAG
ncbi:alpha/beta hydrolase [Paracraurococcus ruber]|nr:alpha/beta hydrolase [Paracraurococcus ruber]